MISGKTCSRGSCWGVLLALILLQRQPGYLHFRWRGAAGSQNLVEKHGLRARLPPGQRAGDQPDDDRAASFLQLLSFADRIEESEENQYENMIAAMVMKYIEEHYRGGTLAGAGGYAQPVAVGARPVHQADVRRDLQDMQQRKRFQVALELLCGYHPTRSTTFVYAVGMRTAAISTGFSGEISDQPAGIPRRAPARGRSEWNWNGRSSDRGIHADSPFAIERERWWGNRQLRPWRTSLFIVGISENQPSSAATPRSVHQNSLRFT